MDIIDALVPIFVCVVLPVAVVAIYYGAQINSDNRRAQILMKAIEANCGPDADKLAEALHKPKKTAREILNLRLLRGCIFSFIGLAICIVVLILYRIHESFPTEVVFIILTPGAISLAIGLSYLVVYFATRKHIKD